MLSVDLRRIELIEEASELDPAAAIRFAFPLTSDDGTAATAVVYFEIEPGNHLAPHRDSAEEVLTVLEGTIEATVGGETATLGAGSVAVVPAMCPHSVRNTGPSVARVLGVFASAAVVSTFEQPAVEEGETVFVAGASVPLAA